MAEDCSCASGRVPDGVYGDNNRLIGCTFQVVDPRCPQHGVRAQFMRWYANQLLCLAILARMSRWQRFKLRWGL